jgi:hypothetical protein
MYTESRESTELLVCESSEIRLASVFRRGLKNIYLYGQDLFDTHTLEFDFRRQKCRLA